MRNSKIIVQELRSSTPKLIEFPQGVVMDVTIDSFWSSPTRPVHKVLIGFSFASFETGEELNDARRKTARLVEYIKYNILNYSYLVVDDFISTDVDFDSIKLIRPVGSNNNKPFALGLKVQHSIKDGSDIMLKHNMLDLLK